MLHLKSNDLLDPRARVVEEEEECAIAKGAGAAGGRPCIRVATSSRSRNVTWALGRASWDRRDPLADIEKVGKLPAM